MDLWEVGLFRELLRKYVVVSQKGLGVAHAV